MWPRCGEKAPMTDQQTILADALTLISTSLTIAPVVPSIFGKGLKKIEQC